MTMDEIAKLSEIRKRSSRQDIERRIGLLHSAGALVHFNMEGIRDIVILQAEWITKVSQRAVTPS